MKKVSVFGIAALAVAGVLSAQQQVGTVVSTAPFHLRNATVTPGQGVASWPVLSGDKIKAGKEGTTVTFADGSTVTVNPGSEVTITLVGMKPTVNVLSGTIAYSFKTPGAIDVLALGKPQATPDLTGSADPPASIVVPVIIGVAGGLGAGIGIGLGVANSCSVSTGC